MKKVLFSSLLVFLSIANIFAQASEAEILSFEIPNQRHSIINSSEATVNVYMPYLTDLAVLTPSITISDDAVIESPSGASHDFTLPVVYEIKAADETIKEWTVTVTKETNIVYWTFPNSPDNAIADGGIAANLTKEITCTAGGLLQFSNGGKTTQSAHASGWDNGEGTKYFHVEFSTENYKNVRISSAQRSANTGPKDFKLQYKIDDGSWEDLVETINVLNNWIVGNLEEVELPATANNQASVSLRWVMTSNVSAEGGVVQSGGISNIDDIYIFGDKMNDEANFISFSLPNQVSSTINVGDATITVVVPFEVDLTEALKAEFTVSENAEVFIGDDEQESGVSENVFENPVSYKVIAENLTEKTWIVTTSHAPASEEADIITFTIPNMLSSDVNSTNSKVTVVMPYETDISALTPTISLSVGASISPVSGLQQNFVSPVNYTVTAQDETTTKLWEVTVSTAPASTEANIIEYSIPNQISSEIIVDDLEVNVLMPFNTDLTALVASFQLSYGASALVGITPQISGVTANNFSSSVNYLVTAEDGIASNTWIINVENALPDTNANIISFDIEHQISSIINVDDTTISILMPYGTDATSLIPTITISENASITPIGGVVQDFSSEVEYTVTAQDINYSKIWKVSLEVKLNDEANILSFEIPNQKTVSINLADTTIDVVMPYGTDLSDLIPVITISGDAEIDPASGIAQDFSEDVVYTVTAQNGDVKEWIVKTIAALNDEADIISFTIDNQESSSIDYSDTTILVIMPYGEELTALIPTITISEAATISPLGGLSQDFTNVVEYTVLAQNEINTKVWKVTVNHAVPSDEANILSFDIPNQESSTIDLTDTTISVIMPYGVALTALSPTITISELASISPISGVEQDFSNTVEYVVTAQDGTTKKYWQVDVANALPNEEADILTFSIPNQFNSIINYDDTTINVYMHLNTNLTALVADFSLSFGAQASIGGSVQVSGVNSNDFTNEVVYTVVAQDGIATKEWKVTVIKVAKYDLAIIFPNINYVLCNFDIEIPFDVIIQNVGDSIITAGTTIPISGTIGNTTANEVITLTADLVPDAQLNYTFTQTFDISNFQVYDYSVVINYDNDVVPSNDSVSGTIDHKDWLLQIEHGPILELFPHELPYTLSVEGVYDTYLWKNEQGLTLGSNSTLEISSFGHYYLTASYNNSNCEGSDTIWVKEKDFIDIELYGPPSGDFILCDLTADNNFEIFIKNSGSANIAAGEILYLSAQIEDVIIHDTITLASNLFAGDIIQHVFSQTFDLSAYQVYTFKSYIYYEHDMDNANDTVVGTIEHRDFSVQIQQGDTVTLLQNEFPYQLSLTDTYDSYEWKNENNVVVGTQSTLDINSYGTYYITVGLNNSTCTASDTIVVKEEDFIDLTIVMPPSGDYKYCFLNDESEIDIIIRNNGNVAIQIGDTIPIIASINTTTVNDTIFLVNVLYPGNTLSYTINQTFDMLAFEIYNFEIIVDYQHDMDNLNDTVVGTIEHIDFNVEIEQGDEISLLASDFPFDLSLTQTYDFYSWTNQNGILISSQMIASIFDYGVYYVSAGFNNSNCVAIDSIIVTEADYVDLVIINPESVDFEFCFGHINTPLEVTVKNIGNASIPVGDTLHFSASFNLLSANEMLILEEELNPNEELEYTFTATFDLSTVQQYDFEISVFYAHDINSLNDTVSGIANHIDFSVEIENGDTIVVYGSDFPVELSLTDEYDNYEWSDSQNNIIGVDSIVNISNAGWYYIEVWSDNNNCYAVDSILVEVIINVNEITNNRFVLYPNPTNDKLFIYSDVYQNNTKVIVSTIDGRQINTYNFNANEFSIDFSNYAKGMYFIGIYNDNNQLFMHRVAVE